MSPTQIILGVASTLVLLAGTAALVQTIRLQQAQLELEQVKTEAARAQGEANARAERDKLAKERSDHELSNALTRVDELATRLRNIPVRSDIVPPAPANARSGDPTLACYDRGKLNAELAAVSRRHAERLSQVAREGESLAAALRACKAWGAGLQAQE